MEDIPNLSCAKAGRAAYSQVIHFNLLKLPLTLALWFNLKAVKYNKTNSNSILVQSSYFMSYHSALTTSSDYYTALKNARKIAKDIQNTIESELEQSVIFYPYR